MKDLKILIIQKFQSFSDFDKIESDKFEKLIDEFLEKIDRLNKKLLIIKNLNLIENIKFEEDFNLIQSNFISSTFIWLELSKHLSQIFEINKNSKSIYELLKNINEFFPEESDINDNNLSLTPLKEFNFPINFLKIISKNFSSEINKKHKNIVSFENTNLVDPYEINYLKYLEKIYKIIENGSDYSNMKVIKSNTTYISGRKE